MGSSHGIGRMSMKYIDKINSPIIRSPLFLWLSPLWQEAPFILLVRYNEWTGRSIIQWSHKTIQSLKALSPSFSILKKKSPVYRDQRLVRSETASTHSIRACDNVCTSFSRAHTRHTHTLKTIRQFFFHHLLCTHVTSPTKYGSVLEMYMCTNIVITKYNIFTMFLNLCIVVCIEVKRLIGIYTVELVTR